MTSAGLKLNKHTCPEALTGALAFLLAASWIPPSTIADVRRNSQIVGGPYPLEANNIWYGLLAAVVLGRAAGMASVGGLT